METIEIATARKTLSELVRRAEEGHITLLTRYGKTVAAIGPANVMVWSQLEDDPDFNQQMEAGIADIEAQKQDPAKWEPVEMRRRQETAKAEQRKRDDLLKGFGKK